MLGVLALLCAFFSWVTYKEQHPTGASAGAEVARRLDDLGAGAAVLVVAGKTPEDAAFVGALRDRLEVRGVAVDVSQGGPPDARRALEAAASGGRRLDVVACTEAVSRWAVLDRLAEGFPGIGSPRIASPRSYRWPDFLKRDNIVNVANQIVVIAVIAIGMTLVIITAGIDLSVGSLIALSAVTATLLIRDLAGAEEATPLGMTLASLGGIVACGLVGLFSGAMITVFGIPPFIVTLAMMLVGSGLAFLLTQGQSVYQVPDSYVWLGRGSELGVPNAVLLMAALYAVAHVVMTRMTFGRHVYAVGGNPEAARLSGVPVRRVIVAVYTACGALAGLGGVITASRLRSGSPTYGQMYELYVIAAVVVGGTSLAGGEGKVLGTLIGAFIIAVIQNGMNLTNVESYTQKVVLGLVILGAVLLDRLKRKGWAGRVLGG